MEEGKQYTTRIGYCKEIRHLYIDNSKDEIITTLRESINQNVEMMKLIIEVEASRTKAYSILLESKILKVDDWKLLITEELILKHFK